MILIGIKANSIFILLYMAQKFFDDVIREKVEHLVTTRMFEENA